jgi:hypothetical protein
MRYVDAEDSEELIAELINYARAERFDEREWLFVMIAGCHQPILERLVARLNAEGVAFFGAVFPVLIFDGNLREHGAVVLRVPIIGRPSVIKMDDDGDVVTPLPETELARTDIPTMFMFVDFTSRSVIKLLSLLFDRYAERVSYFGCGVGTGERKPQPVVFCTDGAFGDAAICALVDRSLAFRLAHGWRRIEGPLVATKTDGNVVVELNWEPAEQVYRRALVEYLSSSEVKDGDPLAPEVLKRYPFGIRREGAEDVVRDPLYFTEDGALVCQSDIAENSVLYVLEGTAEGLINSARSVAEFDPLQPISLCWLFDCFTRSKLLGPSFTEELDAIRASIDRLGRNARIIGALALGEVASDGNRPG